MARMVGPPTTPEAVRVAGGSGFASSLAVVAGIALVAIVAFAGRQAPDPAPETVVAAGPAAPSADRAEAPTATPVPPLVVHEPLPGTSVPGTGWLAIVAEAGSVRPEAVWARLTIDGRSILVGELERWRDDRFAAWVSVRPRVGEVRAARLELYDGRFAESGTRRLVPLAVVPFRIAPAGPIVLRAPSLPYTPIEGDRVVVEGTTAPELRRVSISLLTRGEVLASIGVTTEASGPRHRRPFVAELAIPAPPPRRVLWIELVAGESVHDPAYTRLRVPIRVRGAVRADAP